MGTTLLTVDCKLFQMMPYIIILKVRKFHWRTASRFSTARKKPVGDALPPSLNNVEVTKYGNIHETALLITKFSFQEVFFVVKSFLPNFKWPELLKYV